MHKNAKAIPTYSLRTEEEGKNNKAYFFDLYRTARSLIL